MTATQAKNQGAGVAETADLIVVGGGIFGLMIAHEAGLRGRRAILLEKGEVGRATSANWFRILHGGLRYLQSLDFARTIESARERRWFLKFAPDLVEPMPFLMPLYGRGTRSPLALSAAFALDASLTFWRNSGVSPRLRLAPGRVLGPPEARSVFPDIPMDGLRGAALWNEIIVPDTAALIARLRMVAEANGATVVEHCAAETLATDNGRVRGVRTSDGNAFEAPVVINAAGPWSTDLATRFGSRCPDIFRPVLAFNLLLDRPPISEVGLAVADRSSSAPALFLYPLEGRTFAGTWNCHWDLDNREARVPETEIDAFLAALAAAAPTLGARREHVVRVFPGLQPARREGSVEIAHRDTIVDHGAQGGPKGLYSLSGIKFTTARRVATKVLEKVERGRHWNEPDPAAPD